MPADNSADAAAVANFSRKRYQRLLKIAGDPRPTATALRVFIVIACRFANAKRGGACWASVSTIAKEASASPRSTQEALAQLVDIGFLEAERRAGRPTVYRLQQISDQGPNEITESVHQPEFLEPKISHLIQGESGGYPCEHSRPSTPAKVRRGAETRRGAKVRVEGVRTLAPKPSKGTNREEIPSESHIQRSAAPIVETSSDLFGVPAAPTRRKNAPAEVEAIKKAFLKFSTQWAECPHAPKDNPKKAASLSQRFRSAAERADLEDILEGSRLYTTHPDRARFWHNPWRWLGSDSWRDELAKSRNPGLSKISGRSVADRNREFMDAKRAEVRESIIRGEL